MDCAKFCWRFEESCFGLNDRGCNYVQITDGTKVIVAAKSALKTEEDVSPLASKWIRDGRNNILQIWQLELRG